MGKRWGVVAGFTLLMIGALVLSVPDGVAFERYTAAKNAFGTNCAQCHGDYRDSPYTSLSDGQSWGDDLMSIHVNLMLDGDCDTCHASGRNPVFLNHSNGGTGLDPIGCIGCHGRVGDRHADADCVDPPNQRGPCGDGAGLRQHHWNADRIISTVNGPVSTRICASCHSDADPANFTPSGEHILPPYYFTPDSNHPDKPTDPCNPPPDFPEDFKGSLDGLNNDGDFDISGPLNDQFDPDCQPQLVNLTLDFADLMWTPIPSAAGYDTVRGDLGILRTTAGDFSLATEMCFENDWPGTILSHSPDPLPGQWFFYLVRVEMSSTTGSYNSGGPGQVAPRDQGVADSGFDCL